MLAIIWLWPNTKHKHSSRQAQCGQLLEQGCSSVKRRLLLDKLSKQLSTRLWSTCCGSYSLNAMGHDSTIVCMESSFGERQWVWFLVLGGLLVLRRGTGIKLILSWYYLDVFHQYLTGQKNHTCMERIAFTRLQMILCLTCGSSLYSQWHRSVPTANPQFPSLPVFDCTYCDTALDNLPPELIKRIVYYLERYKGQSQLPVLQQPSLAPSKFPPYATLSRPWKEAVELVTFHSLRIKSDEFSPFQAIMTGNRRKFLFNLGYKILLPEYSEEAYSRVESDDCFLVIYRWFSLCPLHLLGYRIR